MTTGNILTDSAAVWDAYEIFKTNKVDSALLLRMLSAEDAETRLTAELINSLLNAVNDLRRLVGGDSPGGTADAPVRFIDGLKLGDLAGSGPSIRPGTGSPEGVVSALVGSVFLRTDGGTATTAYIKETGAGSTGWVPVAPGGGGPGGPATNTVLMDLDFTTLPAFDFTTLADGVHDYEGQKVRALNMAGSPGFEVVSGQGLRATIDGGTNYNNSSATAAILGFVAPALANLGPGSRVAGIWTLDGSTVTTVNFRSLALAVEAYGSAAQENRRLWIYQSNAANAEFDRFAQVRDGGVGSRQGTRMASIPGAIALTHEGLGMSVHSGNIAAASDLGALAREGAVYAPNVEGFVSPNSASRYVSDTVNTSWNFAAFNSSADATAEYFQIKRFQLIQLA